MMLSGKKIQKPMLNSNGNVYNVYVNYRFLLLFSLYYYAVIVKWVN